MRWFWQKEKEALTPAPSNVCSHIWSNWSEPGECRVTLWNIGYGGGERQERDGWSQDRHCLQCNIYERRTA